MGKKYTSKTNDALPRKIYKVEQATVRSETMRSGNVAFSPPHHCDTTQAIRRTPNTVNSAIWRPSLQGYRLPPHWSAINRQIIAGTKRIVPTGSNWRNAAIQLPCFRRSLRGGDGRNRMIQGTAIAPIGKLTGVKSAQPYNYLRLGFSYCRSTNATTRDLSGQF